MSNLGSRTHVGKTQPRWCKGLHLCPDSSGFLKKPFPGNTLDTARAVDELQLLKSDMPEGGVELCPSVP